MADRRPTTPTRPTSPTPLTRRPGGRSQRVWEAVSNAVLELLVKHGQEAVTMIEVARRAGVNPTSLYRRWGTREALLTEVLAARAESALAVPDTGTLRGDLTAYLKSAALFLQTPNGAALLQLGVTALGRPDLQPFRRDYLLGRLPPVATILERAAARGEIEPGADPLALIEHLVGPLFVRLIFTARPIDARAIDGSVTAALAALSPASRPASPRLSPTRGRAGRARSRATVAKAR